MTNIKRIRLDADGLVTQDQQGRMQRFVLSPTEIESVKRDPHSCLLALSNRLAWSAEFFSDGRLNARFEVVEERADCLSRPLRIYYGIEPRCNLQCTGCGPRDLRSVSIPATAEFESFLLKEIARAGAFQVQLTGGEIMVRGHRLLETLDEIQALGLAVILATNGVWRCIDRPDEFLRRLAKYDNIIQTNISIDGSPEPHDRIRGRGTYAEAVATLARLSEHGLNPRINTTIFRSTCNSFELDHLVGLAEQYHAKLQLIPIRLAGRASGHQQDMPSRDSLREYTERASKLRAATGVPISFNFDIFNGGVHVPKFDLHRPISCGAPLWGVHLTHRGEVYACGFAQAVNDNNQFMAGKVETEGGLLDIWLHSDVLRRIRGAGKSAQCRACEDYGRGCWGGCWVAAWLESGSTDGMDPYCFREATSKA
jgi:radical SAM protein with 4Fe4S-binding SPASM domain